MGYGEHGLSSRRNVKTTAPGTVCGAPGVMTKNDERDDQYASRMACAPGAVSAYGTVADHAEVSPDSKPSISSTPRSGCG
jgi:hypothetical protein